MSTETPEVTDPTAHWSFETKQVHAGQTPDIVTSAQALPIYQTASYTFNSIDHAAALFGLAETGNWGDLPLRDLGSAAAPFNAFPVAQGLETLSLRVERHVANAQKVAEFLAGHPDVISVNYAGLPSSPWYELGKKLAPKGTGAASTPHAQLIPEEQLATGVTPGLVRLAVGIEGIDDILADLEQGFAAAKPFKAAT
jgi:O-acetylhomoserine/O-acetylserine sulfhydrylase-like pyridoxal-dependent enzyme